MGQRLNIEVRYDGEPVANAYYHWSAYTSSSLNLLGQVIEAYRSRTEINKLKVAVEILQATGAGINEEEKENIAKDTTGRFNNISFQDCDNRNTGLLSVTEQGMEETRKWEEGRVTVDIGTEEFTFDVMIIMDNADFEDCWESSADQLPDAQIDFTEACKFSDFEKFQKTIVDNPNGVRLDDDTVLCWIE